MAPIVGTPGTISVLRISPDRRSPTNKLIISPAPIVSTPGTISVLRPRPVKNTIVTIVLLTRENTH